MECYINTLNKFPTITYDSRVLIKTIWIYVLELPIKQILITEEKEIYTVDLANSSSNCKYMYNFYKIILSL